MQPRIKHVFMLEQENHKSAEALASLPWMQNPENKSTQSFSTTTKDCFHDMRREDFHRMAFIGHSNTTTYGDYRVKEFVNKFEAEFIHCFDDADQSQHKTAIAELKECVKEIDVIGCELGLILDDGSSLAQKIADALAKKGFKNVRIHAVASPSTLPKGAGMIVEVTGRAGLSLFSGAHDGYISAFLLDSEEKAFLDEDPKNADLRLNILMKNPVYFLRNADPDTEFKKAENIFIPGENYEKRLERIHADPNFQARQLQSTNKQLTLQLLNARLDHERDKLGALEDAGKKHKRLKKLTENLRLLIMAVDKSDDSHWQAAIRYNIPRFQSLFFREQKSTTYKLLKRLRDEEFDQAQKIIAEQKNNPKKKNKEDRIVIPSSIATKQSNDQTGKQIKKEPFTRQMAGIDLEKKEKNAADREIRKHRAEEVKKKYKYRMAGSNKELGNAVNEITTLISNLENEIERLSNGCFNWLNPFTRFELNTKRQKLEALKLLIEGRVGDFESLSARARGIKDDPQRVFRGFKANQLGDEWIKNRTGQLIQRIIDGPDNFSYEERPGYRIN